MRSQSKQLHREFQDSQTRTERTRALTAIATGAVLYLLFIFLDRAFFPSQVSVLLAIRLTAVSFMLIGIVVVARARTYWGQVLPSAFTWIIGAGAIGVMCHATGGFSSPYWAGIPLCGIAATIFTWPPRVAALSFALGLVPYYAPLLAGEQHAQGEFLPLSSAFIFATFLLALIGIQIHRRLAFRAFLSHRQLEKSHAQLAELDKSKNRMFQNVSHELRTPLTLMLGPLERRLRGQSDFGASREGVETLHRHGLRLLKLINDLLDLAQLTTKDLPVVRKTIDLRHFVQVLVADARMAADASRIQLATQLPPAAVFYSVDPRHLERILLNLLSNAIKFTPADGKIRVGLEAEPASLSIRVSDDGPGIDEFNLERIFERFEQARGPHEGSTGGAGIGLALVRELAELLEARVTVESKVGAGSCFILTLPTSYLRTRIDGAPSDSLAQAEQLDQQALRAALYRSTAPERIVGGRRGARILIAEDDPDLRLQLAEMLQDHYRIVAVSNGRAALSEALQFRPHLVITDVMMPELDGVELCRRLRQQIEFRRTAVLILTARGSLDDRVDGRSAGADSYLTKPFETQELLSAVSGLLKARMHIVGDFLLHHRLGHGAQSTVFMAEHLVSGQPAALKLITSNRSQPAKRHTQTRLEVRALTLLDHPNVVKILAEYEHHGDIFLAMEYLSGLSMSDYLARVGTLSVGEAAAVIQGVARALGHTHSRGLVHRDVKCSNVVLINESGVLADRIRLIDFGSASFLGNEQKEYAGTPAYMAPEVLSASGRATAQSDVFSAGVMLFRLSTGRLPDEVSEKDGSWQAHFSPSLWRDLASEVPSELRAIFERAIAFERGERWPNAKALAKALDPLADQRLTSGEMAAEPARGVLTPTHPITPFESPYSN